MSRLAVAFSVLLAWGYWLGSAPAQETPAQPQERLIAYDEALALVVQNAYALQLADEDVRDARRRVTRAKRQYHPRLKVQGTMRGDLLEVDEWSREENFGAGMVLDWAPFRNGELLRENTASRVGLTVATLERRQAALDLEHDFLKLYYDILNATDEVELSRLKRDLEERRLKALEQEFEQDRATETDVLKQKGVFFEADAAWRRNRQNLQLKLIELEERTGQDNLAGVEDVDRTIAPANEFSADDCVAAAQGVRIALLTAREQVRLADLGVKYAKLKRLPSVYFFTDSDYRLTQELGREAFELRAGVSVSYPLYDAGDVRATIADAKAAAVRARIKQSQIRLNVEKEIRETYWAYVNTLRLLTSTREREQVFENAFKEAVVLKERDAMSEIEFTAAEIRYRESRQRIRTLELDALFARASLVRAVGIRALGDVTPLEAPAEPGQPAQKEIQ